MTKQTSFWQAAAKTSEIRELDGVKATLRMLHGITKSNKDLELDSLLKNCFNSRFNKRDAEVGHS